MTDRIERRTADPRADLALVRRILRGRRAELPALAERLGAIQGILRLLDAKRGRKLGPDALADLTQDVLVLVWRKLAEYEGLASLEGWVYGICLLEYHNALRRKRRLAREPHSVVSAGGGLEDAALDPDPWAFEDVHDGLRRIGREEAQVIRLKHFEGRTFEEIGNALGLPPSTVKARYYRGIEELRPLLEDRGANP